YARMSSEFKLQSGHRNSAPYPSITHVDERRHANAYVHARRCVPLLATAATRAGSRPATSAGRHYLSSASACDRREVDVPFGCPFRLLSVFSHVAPYQLRVFEEPQPLRNYLVRRPHLAAGFFYMQ